MEDSLIIDLYWQRNQAAIAETQSKYGHYCHAIANNILHNHEDAEEAVNDTYLALSVRKYMSLLKTGHL